MPISIGYKQARGEMNASATKGGPGRYHRQGSGNTSKPLRAYKALMAAWASKRVTKAAQRDQHGAYTLIGKAVRIDHHRADGEYLGTQEIPRRMWLGGISAQRGY